MAPDPENPFGNPDESERTIIRPSPGRRAAAPPQAAPLPLPEDVPRGPLGPPVALPNEGINPIVAAASVLLAVATRLRRATQPQNVAVLRQRVIDELKIFEQKIRALSLPINTVRGAHYAICATIDDIVLNTPWGSQSLWTTQSLVSTFHNEVTGGERFFEILAAMQADPGTNIDVLELMYTCLALGFEGKYRVSQRGTAELVRVQEGLYRLIRQVRGDFERELSPHWRGIPAPHRSLASFVPTWVIALVAAVVVLGAYMGLSFALSDQSDPTFIALAKLPPKQTVAVAIPAQPAAAPAPPRTQQPAFLAREVAEGLAAVKDAGQTVTVTLRASGMFASGSATVEPKSIPLLERIAAELEKQPGRVRILGHTDNVPIRTVRFPSNYALSLARAQAAADIIKAKLSDPGRVTAEGRADADPIQPNTTKEGREANRRIELVLTRAPRA
jgi:type VI secretion system protein ImpK